MTDHLSLDSDRCLSELAYSVSLMLGTPPIASTAICEHVFQSLIEHFYQNGSMYLPSIGWIHYVDGDAVLTPCGAMEQTLTKLSAAIDSRVFSFANIESVLEAAHRANSCKTATQT